MGMHGRRHAGNLHYLLLQVHFAMIGLWPFAAEALASTGGHPPMPAPTQPKVIASATYAIRNALLYDTFVIPSPLYVGDTPSMVIGIGQIIAGTLVLTITRPDGSIYSPAAAGVNNAGLKYAPDSFVTYIFSNGELSQAGKWLVAVRTGSINNTVAAFTVLSPPS